MAKRLVKCKVCGKEFDINTVQGVVAGGRRYAHYSCMPNGELVPLVLPKPKPKKTEDPDLVALNEYINKLFNGQQNHARTKQLIKQFHEENGYSYSGILKTLVYFYEVKGNSIEKANNSIGIVPFCYDDAYNYYLNLFLISNANNKIEDMKEFVSKEKEIIIKEPRRKTSFFKKLFNLEDE